MTKKQQNPLGIFTESIGLYFSNFDKFIKYMSFPVLGQIAGLMLVFFTTYFYSINMPKLIDKYPNLNSLSTLIILAILITLPGLAIFCKAFWEYLVAYGAVNSMLENLLHSGRVYEFDAHKELIQRRAASFIGLWLLFSIFSLIAICPLMWIICAILAIYFVLIFQVFTFEPELSPMGCAKKSFALIKGNFRNTFMLFALAGALTYILIPQIIIKGFDSTGINIAFSNAILPFVKLFPEFDFTMYGLGIIKHSDIALFTVQTTIAQIFVQYTLPLRAILWSLWYKELNNGIPKQELPKKTKKQRPSEKLMSRGKYLGGKSLGTNGKKGQSKNRVKLDDNIIRRAMEKEEDEE